MKRLDEVRVGDYITLDGVRALVTHTSREVDGTVRLEADTILTHTTIGAHGRADEQVEAK